MLLSNRLTYCITTFILLVAFVAVPVMAHGPEDAETVGPHTHPVTEAVEAVVATDTTPAVPAVPIHGAHPTTRIALKSGQSNVSGNMVAVVADDTDTADVMENEFTLLVTFNVDVTNSETQTSIADDFTDIAVGDLIQSEFTFSAVNTKNIAAASPPTLEITRIVDATTTNIVEAGKKQFEVTVTVNEFPSGTEDADDETLTFRIRVNAGGVFALQTTLIGPDGINPVNVPGGGNVQSSILELTLVSALPTDAVPGKPTVDITHSPDDYKNAAKADVRGKTLGSEVITFTVTINEPLGDKDGDDFELSDMIVENGDIVNFSGIGGQPTTNQPHRYFVVVEPKDPTRDVRLTVPKDAVKDTDSTPKGNDAASEVYEIEELKLTVLVPDRPGVLPPAVADPDGDPTKLKFTIISNKALKDGDADNKLTANDIDIDTREVEPLGTGDLGKDDATRLEKVKMDYDGHTVVESYTLTTTPRNLTTDVSVEVRAEAAEAASGTTMPKLTPGAEATYSPEGGKPTIAIEASATPVDSIDGATITITASDNVRIKNNEEIVSSEVVITGADMVSGTFNSTKASASSATATASFDVIPHIGVMEITVTVNANAVRDDANNSNAKKDQKFNVGPIFEIPKNTILVITKSGVGSATYDYLSDQPRLPIDEDPPLPAPDIMVTQWGNMPDLEVLFNLYSRGGTVSMKLHPTDPNYSKAKHEAEKVRDEVRISEVMWAADESIRGGVSNDPEADEQWIEIENYGQHAAKVFLYARTAQSSAATHNSERFNKDNNLSGYFDRIGNAYNGSPGSNDWKVPGNNGNSYTGLENFVSMWRNYDISKTTHERYANGTHKDSWKISDREYARRQSGAENTDNEYQHIGSPGRLHFYNFTDPPIKSGTTAIPGSLVGEHEKVLINEVGNRSNADYEWIELRNYGSAVADLRNFRISVVTAVGTDQELINFAHNDGARIPVGGVLLLVATDPRYDDNHPIAVGYNIDKGAPDQVAGLGLNVADSPRAPARYDVVNFRNGGLPDSGDFVLIVRSPDKDEPHANKNEGGKGWAERGETDLDQITDIAGYHSDLAKNDYPATTPVLNNTKLWPLVNFGAPNLGHNKLEVNQVHRRQKDTTAKPSATSRGIGWSDDKKEAGHAAFANAGYTGIGYKRTARRNLAVHNGTPGYHGNEVNTVATSSVTISEVMYSTGANGTLPQWIELYNSSATKVVNIGSGWRIMIETLDADGNALDNLLTIHFGQKGRVKHIYPQQTVLVAAGNARQAGSDFQAASVVFAENRLFNVYRDIGASELKSGDEFKNDRYMFFNPKAFHIALLDKDGKLVDGVGNLDGDSRTNDTVLPDQEFPSAVTDDGVRSSIIRIYDDGVARTGSGVVPMPSVANERETKRLDKNADGVANADDIGMGIDPKYAWIPAVNTGTEFKITIKSTWYGDEDDYGTPGHRRGLVLPVQLSSFRPTLEDGVVTIRWTTESELDNAGFNIYRSEERDGGFKQVNTQLIEGAGTTGERSNYSWVDQTAKPGVVYYYQIEDVSFAGDREALMITKLKGLISAKNKLTTTWSELKEASQ